MLTATSRPYIEASVPVLREHGNAITRHFYARMLSAHPELNNLFNQGNQAAGLQPQSLASAVFAYAANIDNAAALAPVLERIVHKHASLGVTPGQYTIVGRHLLGSIAEVLGEAATPELLAAWDEAYWLLAGELIAAEARLYQRTGCTPGQLHTLRVREIRDEAQDVRSYYLEAAEGGSPGEFLPGQYVSVAVDLPERGLRQLRQYSLSDAPNKPWWRITVKREAVGLDQPQGMVSNHLHRAVKVGDSLQVSPAFGDFHPQLQGERPLVLLSAGVGLTPMVGLVAAMADVPNPRPVLFAHATRNGAHHALRADLAQARARLPGLREVVFYDSPRVEDTAGTDYHHTGRMTLDALLDADTAGAEFCLCGPQAFMRERWTELIERGVSPGDIQREVFGPDLLEHLLN